MMKTHRYSILQSIEEFVTVLDQRKDEAIERTYQQVSSAFKTTFESLVPNGAGELERPTYSGDNASRVNP